MEASLLRKPSALLPVGMSIGALIVVIAYAALYGTARQADEGAAAHIWQLLIGGQVPVIVYFAAKWLPASPREAVLVLALQALAVLAAMFPVWWFQW